MFFFLTLNISLYWKDPCMALKETPKLNLPLPTLTERWNHNQVYTKSNLRSCNHIFVDECKQVESFQ